MILVKGFSFLMIFVWLFMVGLIIYASSVVAPSKQTKFLQYLYNLITSAILALLFNYMAWEWILN